MLAATLIVATAAGADAPAAPRVTVITDSVGGVLFWATKPREDLGARLDLQLETKTCRKLVDPGCPAYGDEAPESALATIDRLGPALGRVVVIDVGYNDHSDLYAAGLDEVMTALVAAGVQHVVWVTLEETEGWAADQRRDSRGARAVAAAHGRRLGAGRRGPAVVRRRRAHELRGCRRLWAFLRPFVLDACGAPCAPPPPAFCGLARTVNGFDAVAASLVTCGSALATIVHIERGDRGAWAVHAPSAARSSSSAARASSSFRSWSARPRRDAAQRHRHARQLDVPAARGATRRPQRPRAVAPPGREGAVLRAGRAARGAGGAAPTAGDAARRLLRRALGPRSLKGGGRDSNPRPPGPQAGLPPFSSRVSCV